MTSSEAGIRPLTSADLDWVVEVTRQRRADLARHALRFWHPADDATERHRAFLAHLVDAAEVLSIRSQHGYLIAVDRGEFWLVDDMAVSRPERWTTEGTALLRHTQDRCGRLRFVVPAFEPARLRAAHDVGLEAVECWWHRDLDAVGSTSDIDGDPVVTVDGAHGRLVPAPPVYDPGGPVLLVTEVKSVESLRRIEEAAHRRGAPVSVVTQRPWDTDLAVMLRGAGYVLTTLFCEPPN